jgi:hypothetical protein
MIGSQTLGKAWDRVVALKRRLALRTRLRQLLRNPRRSFRMHIVKKRYGLEWFRNLWIDWRYGGYCGGVYQSRFDATGAWGTSSVDYYQMPRLFHAKNGTALKRSDVLVDVGCGKGRVINWWLTQGLGNKIYGVELDEQFASMTAQRLKRFPNVQILCGSILDNLPADATTFFLFNPFKAPVMEAFKNRLIEVYGEDAPIRIIYFMCLYVDVFKNDPRFVVEPMRTKTFWPAVVIRLRAAVEGRAGAGETESGQAALAEGSRR